MISAIHDDMEEYEALCKKYNEQPLRKSDAYGNMLLDCYSEHASGLIKRRNKEWLESINKPLL
jgi:hypothetical protein